MSDPFHPAIGNDQDFRQGCASSDAVPRSKECEALLLEYTPRGMHDPDYARFFTKSRVVAWQYGFALIAHGSFTRDLDLLVVPWEERANEKMAHRLINQIAIHSNMTIKGEPKPMPHGRLGYTLLFPPDANGIHDPRWVDLSVMPCRPAPTTQGADYSASPQDVELDAGRYRWLRSIDGGRCAIYEIDEGGAAKPFGILIGGHADALIDAAMKEVLAVPSEPCGPDTEPA